MRIPHRTDDPGEVMRIARAIETMYKGAKIPRTIARAWAAPTVVSMIGRTKDRPNSAACLFSPAGSGTGRADGVSRTAGADGARLHAEGDRSISGKAHRHSDAHRNCITSEGVASVRELRNRDTGVYLFAAMP